MANPTKTDRFKMIVDYVKNIFSKNPFVSNTPGKVPVPQGLFSLIIAAEENIKQSSEMVRKRISSFIEHELPKQKDQSKEEITRIAVALTEYSNALQRISEEKLKYISQLKLQLQSRVMTSEEVRSTVKYFDEKMLEIKNASDELYKKLSTGETSVFLKELQTTVEMSSARLKTAVDAFLVMLSVFERSAAEFIEIIIDASAVQLHAILQRTVATIEEVYKSMIYEKDVSTKFVDSPKLSTPKLNPPNPSQAEGFSKDPRGAEGIKEAAPEVAVKTSLVPLTVREKLKSLNLGKHFNADTIQGRANVAKATYAGLALIGLYLYFKPSKSKQTAN